MMNSMDKLMECPVCLELMKAPIRQCEKGHSICGECITANNITQCPLCRARMLSTRNYNLEEVIENIAKRGIKVPCKYQGKGCTIDLKREDVAQHETECNKRTYQCEGKTFCSWACDWTGNHAEILDHFKANHKNQSSMEFKTEVNMKIDFRSNFKDLQIINFSNGQQLFWYKHKIDMTKQKAYWAFQMLGLKKSAGNYYYEFEVSDGPVRKFKVTEICQNDTTDVEKIFQSEKCVVMTFTTIRNYLNKNGELPFRFRIMKIRNPTDYKPTVRHHHRSQ